MEAREGSPVESQGGWVEVMLTQGTEIFDARSQARLVFTQEVLVPQRDAALAVGGFLVDRPLEEADLLAGSEVAFQFAGKLLRFGSFGRPPGSHNHIIRLGRRNSNAPNGIRIHVYGLKGRCPRPLDDGGATFKSIAEL